MSRIAIIGSGVAGLTAAHRLQRDHEITLYEAAPRVGGHVHTVRVDLADETHEIDTGFIVHNDRNYPGFQALMDELGVATQPSHMSFSVSDDAGSFEYSGTPRGVFAQRSHLARPALPADDPRPAALQPRGYGAGGRRDQRRTFAARDARRRRLLGLVRRAADRSAGLGGLVGGPEQLWSFPAGFLASFFANHGMLGFRDRPRWRTVTGGSQRYVERADRARSPTASGPRRPCAR